MDVSGERVIGRGFGSSRKMREGAKIRERDVLFYILGALWGFVTGMAALPFSSAPFGFAAIAVCSRYLIGVVLGAAVSCIVTRSYELVAAYAIVLICRAVFSALAREKKSAWLFCEPPALRAVSAATGALALGIYRLVASGFLYYHVIGTVLTMVLSAVLVPFWYTAVSRDIEGKYTAWRIAAVCSMAALTVYALSDIAVYGISLSVFSALTLTLFAVRHKGISYGVLIAICTGVFTSVTYAPLFILAAVSFALLRRVSLGLACFSALAVGGAWGIYMTGIAAISEVFPGLFAASVIFVVIDKLFFERENSFAETSDVNAKKSDGVALAESNVKLMKSDNTLQRIESLCGALVSLSESIVLVEDKFKASAAVPRGVSGGSLSAVIDGEMAVVKRKSAKKSAGTKSSENTEMAEYGRHLDSAVCSRGYAAELAIIADCIVSIIREAQEADEYPGEVLSKPFLVAHTAGRRKRAPAEKNFCGDSFDVVNGEDGKLYAFISDGMGSGREAAHASEMCAAFLRELLPTGVSACEAFKMLNGLLRLSNSASVSECTATADIVDIDLYRSRARIYKSGAAPTFIFHDGAVKKISARTMPLGIMGEVDVAVCESEIFFGDTIVMLSDGVTEGREECPELCEFIRSRLITHSADQLADAIISYTQKNGTQDDVSVVVIKIEQSEII